MLIFITIARKAVKCYSAVVNSNSNQDPDQQILMTIFERRQRLLELMHTEPGLRVPEIARVLGVSEGTIRNDLDALAESKQLIRVRGGAAVVDMAFNRSSAFAARVRVNEEAKKWIGRQAAALVQDGDSLLLDASTTVYTMATFLMERRGLRVVTNGIQVARLLVENPTNTVILVGGILRANAESCSGPWAEQFLAGLRTQYAFFSCSGFTPEGGMTEVDVFESQFRVQAAQSAGQVLALIDSSKIGKVDLSPSLRPNQLERLYTDSSLAPHWAARLQQSGVQAVICGEHFEESNERQVK